MWSESDFALAVEMRANGFSSAMIALKIGKTRNSVVGKLYRCGVKPGDITHAYRIGFRAKPNRSESRTWSEENLTETWADLKARLAAERMAHGKENA